MKLWLLRPSGYGLDDYKPSGPWDPWYGKAFGFVIRAETEIDARNSVQDRVENGHGDEGGECWLDPILSECVELTADGAPGIIICDFAKA